MTSPPDDPLPPTEPTTSTCLCPSCGRALERRRGACAVCGTAALLNGRFLLLRLLGQGGQGRTYAALDSHSGAEVALKELSLSQARDWKSVELFERSAKVLRQLRHPGLPAFVDAFEIERAGVTFFYQVIELIEGESLGDAARRGERFREDDARHILRMLLPILRALHARQPPIVHRDLKPTNVMRRPDGSLCLIDFGLVREARAEQSGSTMGMGTPGYAPLEQLIGDAIPASDLYALGATLVALLSGREPVSMMAPGQTRIDFRAAARVSPDFAELLERLVAPDFRQRYQSVDEVEEALDAIERQERIDRARAARVARERAHSEQADDEALAEPSAPRTAVALARASRGGGLLKGTSVVALLAGLVGLVVYLNSDSCGRRRASTGAARIEHAMVVTTQAGHEGLLVLQKVDVGDDEHVRLDLVDPIRGTRSARYVFSREQKAIALLPAAPGRFWVRSDKTQLALFGTAPLAPLHAWESLRTRLPEIRSGIASGELVDGKLEVTTQLGQRVRIDAQSLTAVRAPPRDPRALPETPRTFEARGSALKGGGATSAGHVSLRNAPGLEGAALVFNSGRPREERRAEGDARYFRASLLADGRGGPGLLVAQETVFVLHHERVQREPNKPDPVLLTAVGLDGRVRWRRQLGHRWAVFGAAFGPRVVVVTAERKHGAVLALDARTGDVAWRYENR